MHNGKFEKTRGYCTDVFFRQATRWIDQNRNSKRPFFAYITPNAPHAPLQVPEEYRQRYAGKCTTNEAKFYGMIENIDDNFGAILQKIDDWGLRENTLVIFMTDNGGTVAVNVNNGGRRGAKNTPYQGGTHVPSFWRWPAGFKSDVDCDALTAHIDILPTFAEIAGEQLRGDLKIQVEGRSLLPLLKNPTTNWPNRYLVSHVGRWERGKIAEAKFKGCSIRDERFTLVNNSELYDLKNDPAEKQNVISEFPEVVSKFRSEYDKWWEQIQPMLVNETAIGPKVNPYKQLYWKQFGLPGLHH
jgi:arylsulfatase A-like enzyme